jgi:hypothetical protein
MQPGNGGMDHEQVARELLSCWEALPVRSIAFNDERVGGVLVGVWDERAGVILLVGFLLIVVVSIVVLVFLCEASDCLSRIRIKKGAMSVRMHL